MYFVCVQHEGPLHHYYFLAQHYTLSATSRNITFKYRNWLDAKEDKLPYDSIKAEPSSGTYAQSMN